MWLKNHQIFSGWIQLFNRLIYCIYLGRVVCVIIYQNQIICFYFVRKTPFNSFETLQCLTDIFIRNSVGFCHRKCHQSITQIVFSEQMKTNILYRVFCGVYVKNISSVFDAYVFGFENSLSSQKRKGFGSSLIIRNLYLNTIKWQSFGYEQFIFILNFISKINKCFFDM